MHESEVFRVGEQKYFGSWEVAQCVFNIVDGTSDALPDHSVINSRLLLRLHQETLRDVRSEEVNVLFLEE